VYPLWRWYLAGLLFLIVTNAVQMEIPRISGAVINAFKTAEETLVPLLLLPEAERVPVQQLVYGRQLSPEKEMAILSLKLVLFGVMLILFRILSRIGFYWPGRRFEASARMDMFSRLMRLPLLFFEKHKVGDLVSRIANDTGYMRILYAFGALAACNILLSFGFSISRMLSIHPGLTSLALLPFLFTLIYTRFALPKMHGYSLENQRAIGDLTAGVSEAFANVHVIQAAAAQESFARRIDRGNRAVYTSNIRLMMMEMVVFPFIDFLANVGRFVVLLYGGALVIGGALTVGDIITFNLYIANLAFPLSMIGAVLAIYQRGKSAMQRISEVEDYPVERAIVPARPTVTNAPLLQVSGLSFTYPQSGNERGREAVLQDIDFTLEAGQKMGISGPIGSGKSSLFNLITRLYDPAQGSILLQGRDVLSLEPEVLRREVAYAQQKVFLFSDKISSNICFGLEEMSQAEVEAAARSACIYKEVVGFERGWETRIGEKGIRLSGGQKQRLSLARIFLRKPQLLILDDVLSAVDHATEQKLIASLEATEAAVLIASHRSSVLKMCDEILILADGRIIDRGDFPSLTKRHKHLYEEFNVEPE